MKIDKNIEFRSDEVQEILNVPPRFIIRWGITILLLVVFVLLAGSYLFRYPDVIISRVTIISENPPAQIVARTSGKVDELFVVNDQQVQEGDLLAVIENAANYADAYRLMERLDSIAPFLKNSGKLQTISFHETYSLGQYHSFFSSFVSQLRSFQIFFELNPFEQRIRSLEKQIEDYHVFYHKSKEQAGVLSEDFELAYGQFTRDSILFRQELLSEADFETSKATMLKQKFAYHNAHTGLANTQITMNNLRQQVIEQKVLKAEMESQLLASLKEKYDNLVNQLIGWEQAFILKTPIAGQVTFTSVWSENQNVSEGDIVFTVVPGFKQNIVGRAQVPIAGAGKIKKGQRVNVKLDNYPHMEFGMVEGRITNISKVPVSVAQGSFYTVEIAFVDELKTNYNKDLPFSQEMQGKAEIITSDRRLIERLVDPLLSLAKERL